jgi:hypothetical protein
MAKLPRRVGAMPSNPLRNSLARSTLEAQAQWHEHEKAVARIYREWDRAVSSLGEEEALWHWKKATAKRERGRPPGPAKPGRYEELLKYYDVLMKEDPSLNPAKIGVILHEVFRHNEYGSSAAGVTKTLLRQLKKRAGESALHTT